MDKKNQKERRVKKRRQAEEALRASEVRHQAILEWALDAIISVDREGRIIEFNKAAEAMFGHAAKDTIGKEMTTLIIPPALRERHRAGWERHLATGTTSIICKRIEITAMRADGAEFPIELIVTRFGPDGNPTFTAFIRDITERKQAEETIRESAKLVRAIFEQAPIGIAVLNSHTGQFLEINNKYCGIAGFSAAEMLRRTFQDITHPDDLQGDLSNMKLLLEGKIKSFEMDKRYIRKDNSTVWVHLTVVPLWRGEEQPRLHIAMVEDITERKETEESLQESQRFLSALIGNLPGMVYRCRNDRNWTVTYISEGCVSLTGYHPSDFLDNQIHYGRLVHPDDQDRIWNEVQTALRKKKSFMLTYRIRTAAGEEKWVWEQGRSVLASNGELLFLEGFVTDITERKEIAEKLRATETFLRVITDNVPDAIFMKDLAGRYLMANPAALRVLHPDDPVPDKVIGKTDMDLLPRKTAEEFARTDKLLFESGKPVKRFEEEVTPDGTRTWEAVKVPCLDEQGKMRGLISVSRDITERKRAESLIAGENCVLEMIATGASLPAVLEMLIRFIEEQSEGMLGSILLLDEEGKTLRHGAAPSLPEAYTKAIDGVCIGPRVGSCGTAAYRREPVIVSDIASDPLWALYRDLALSHGLRACWSTPIFSRSGAVLGTFAMYYRAARSPNPVETQLIEIATRIAGIATERHREEEALRESEERFDLAVRGANEGLWDGRPLPGEPWYSPRTPLWWSPRVREMLGFSQEEFPDVLESWAALLHPEDKERVFAALAAHIESKVPYEAEYRLRTKQGEYRWFRARGQAIWDHAGKLLRMAGNLNDITERKRAEDTLRALVAGTAAVTGEAFFQVFVRQLAVATGTRYAMVTELIGDEQARVRILAIWTGDRLGTAFEFDLIHTPCKEVFIRGMAYHPDSVQEIYPKDKGLVDLEAVGYLGITLVGGSGKPIGHVCVLHDKPLREENTIISIMNVFAARAAAELERKQAEKQLVEAHSMLDKIVGNIPLYVFWKDRESNYLGCNRLFAESAGVGEPAAIVGKNDYALAWRETAELYRADDRHVMETNTPKLSFEEPQTRPGGSVLWLRTSKVPLQDQDGKVFGVLGIYEDITERKQAEDERARLLKEVQDSHERLQYLSRRMLEVQEEERRRLARELHDQTGQSLTSLLVGLRVLEELPTLAEAQAQAGDLRKVTAHALDEVKRLALGLRPTVLDDLGLEAALTRLAQESAKTYGVSVDLHVKGLPNHRLSPPVETGLYRLTQEALTNTGRHAAARNVSILLTCSESSVKLIVEDDGRGFDVEKALRLPGSSHHLGLLGMHERVALLNGTISVESTLGSGTTIYVQLPLEARPS